MDNFILLTYFILLNYLIKKIFLLILYGQKAFIFCYS